MIIINIQYILLFGLFFLLIFLENKNNKLFAKIYRAYSVNKIKTQILLFLFCCSFSLSLFFASQINGYKINGYLLIFLLIICALSEIGLIFHFFESEKIVKISTFSSGVRKTDFKDGSYDLEFMDIVNFWYDGSIEFWGSMSDVLVKKIPKWGNCYYTFQLKNNL